MGANFVSEALVYFPLSPTIRFSNEPQNKDIFGNSQAGAVGHIRLSVFRFGTPSVRSWTKTSNQTISIDSVPRTISDEGTLVQVNDIVPRFDAQWKF